MGQLLPFLLDINQVLFAISANLMLDNLMDKDWQLFPSSVSQTKVITASSVWALHAGLYFAPESW